MSNPQPDSVIHSPSELTQPQTITTAGDINLHRVLTVAFAGIIVVAAVIIAVSAWFKGQQNQQLLTKSYSVVDPTLVDLHSQQLKNITSYRWIDQKNGVVAVPVERAMELEISGAVKP